VRSGYRSLHWHCSENTECSSERHSEAKRSTARHGTTGQYCTLSVSPRRAVTAVLQLLVCRCVNIWNRMCSGSRSKRNYPTCRMCWLLSYQRRVELRPHIALQRRRRSPVHGMSSSIADYYNTPRRGSPHRTSALLGLGLQMHSYPLGSRSHTRSVHTVRPSQYTHTGRRPKGMLLLRRSKTVQQVRHSPRTGMGGQKVHDPPPPRKLLLGPCSLSAILFQCRSDLPGHSRRCRMLLESPPC